MLLNLHVKNLALIDECEIDFSKGLNILTGETGAGKSIIIDSVNMALGSKVPKDIIRKDADYGLVELVFTVENNKQVDKLKELDVFVEDNQVIISKKILNQRSISKINGETVSNSLVKEVSSILIDIHGQHEHQSLLNKKKHLEILDEYSREKSISIKENIQKLYKDYISYTNELENNTINDEEKNREISFLNFEINEIEDADLKIGEDEFLEKEYKRLANGKCIVETLSKVYDLTGYDGNAAGAVIGRAVKEIDTVTEYDSLIADAAGILSDVDAILNDFNRTLSDYMAENDFSESEFKEVEGRLDKINSLKAKYGKTIENIIEAKEEKKDRLKKLEDHDEYILELKERINKTKEALENECHVLSKIRKENSKDLIKAIKDNLIDLNFLQVEFDIDFRKLDHFTSNGTDEVEFMISTNPGESLKPLGKVASGGELSRIMLAIKTVLASSDDIETLIFDEIDTGISGRTAQKVSEKMSVIGRNHQVICITHLPQIAAMADTHFLIEKSFENNSTVSSVKKLNNDEAVEEIARILGGAKITDTELNNAKEMRELAKSTKN